VKENVSETIVLNLLMNSYTSGHVLSLTGDI